MSRSATAIEKWRGIVQEQSASGQTVAVFSRERGISASSLFAWRRRLKPARTPMAFVQARLTTDAAPNQPVDGIEILCAGGRRVVVRRGFDSTALSEVVKALEALA